MVSLLVMTTASGLARPSGEESERKSSSGNGSSPWMLVGTMDQPMVVIDDRGSQISS